MLGPSQLSLPRAMPLRRPNTTGPLPSCPLLPSVQILRIPPLTLDLRTPPDLACSNAEGEPEGTTSFPCLSRNSWRPLQFRAEQNPFAAGRSELLTDNRLSPDSYLRLLTPRLKPLAAYSRGVRPRSYPLDADSTKIRGPATFTSRQKDGTSPPRSQLRLQDLRLLFSPGVLRTKRTPASSSWNWPFRTPAEALRAQSQRIFHPLGATTGPAEPPQLLDRFLCRGRPWVI